MINLPEISNLLNKKESSKINSSTSKDNKAYDYFSVRIPKNCIENTLKAIKDERFLFFIKYGILRRYEGECDIIYVEIPQIPKKLVIYRRPYCRMKSLNKLNLSRKDLPHIPLFEGEDNLKYLSLELNRITKIERLISLNNLIYLNLYGNYITEIENLSYTNKLRVLLLGKNNIEKIKNLNSLIDLEILDLHSNKIKVIENISNLQKLRILNLANNLITSITDLIYNRGLEEINVRKNLIETMPNMNDFQMLKKVNIAKNLIKKVEYIFEFNKLKFLQELIFENNPISNNTENLFQNKNFALKSNYYSNTPLSNPLSNSVGKNKFSFESLLSVGSVNGFRSINNFNKKKFFSVTKTPTIKSLDKNKYIITTNLKRKIIDKKETLNNTIHSRDVIQAKDNITYNKSFIDSQMVNPTVKIVDITSLNSKNNKTSTSSDFYGKIFPIKQSWNYEINNIISKGYNGYINKKYKEINISQGHVEIKGDSALYLYGNCLKILTQNEYYEKIKLLSFNYFCYDFITCKKMLEYIKEFKYLNNIKFSNNNIHSFYQLTKLESFDKIEKLSIIDNEICNGCLFKHFIVYRLNTLKSFNNQILNGQDRNLSKKIFQFFDILISMKEKEINVGKEKTEEEDNNNNKNIEDNLYYLEENKNKFFYYAKFNLSVAIEELIQDENNSED